MTQNTLDRIARYKFIYLLVSLLLLFLIHPLFHPFVAARILLLALVSVVFLTAVYSISERKGFRIIAFVLLLPALVGTWAGYFVDHGTLHLMVRFFSLLFFAYMGVLIAAGVFQAKRVTTDTISGAICVYLLIGLTWGELYSAIEFFQPGSFTIDRFLPDAVASQPEYRTPLFLYYSFVTLTTLGYGDIIPLTPPARAFAYVEAVIGQIFVAVLIARLVGLHIVHSATKDSD